MRDTPHRPTNFERSPEAHALPPSVPVNKYRAYLRPFADSRGYALRPPAAPFEEASSRGEAERTVFDDYCRLVLLFGAADRNGLVEIAAKVNSVVAGASLVGFLKEKKSTLRVPFDVGTSWKYFDFSPITTPHPKTTPVEKFYVYTKYINVCLLS